MNHGLLQEDRVWRSPHQLPKGSISSSSSSREGHRIRVGILILITWFFTYPRPPWYVSLTNPHPQLHSTGCIASPARRERVWCILPISTPFENPGQKFCAHAHYEHSLANLHRYFQAVLSQGLLSTWQRDGPTSQFGWNGDRKAHIHYSRQVLL